MNKLGIDEDTFISSKSSDFSLNGIDVCFVKVEKLNWDLVVSNITCVRNDMRVLMSIEFSKAFLDLKQFLIEEKYGEAFSILPAIHKFLVGIDVSCEDAYHYICNLPPLVIERKTSSANLKLKKILKLCLFAEDYTCINARCVFCGTYFYSSYDTFRFHLESCPCVGCFINDLLLVFSLPIDPLSRHGGFLKKHCIGGNYSLSYFPSEEVFVIIMFLCILSNEQDNNPYFINTFMLGYFGGFWTAITRVMSVYNMSNLNLRGIIIGIEIQGFVVGNMYPPPLCMIMEMLADVPAPTRTTRLNICLSYYKF